MNRAVRREDYNYGESEDGMQSCNARKGRRWMRKSQMKKDAHNEWYKSSSLTIEN